MPEYDSESNPPIRRYFSRGQVYQEIFGKHGHPARRYRLPTVLCLPGAAGVEVELLTQEGDTVLPDSGTRTIN